MAEKLKRKLPPKRKMTKAEQSERFKETARTLEADETGEAFERVFHKTVHPKHRSKNKPAA